MICNRYLYPKDLIISEPMAFSKSHYCTVIDACSIFIKSRNYLENKREHYIFLAVNYEEMQKFHSRLIKQNCLIRLVICSQRFTTNSQWKIVIPSKVFTITGVHILLNSYAVYILSGYSLWDEKKKKRLFLKRTKMMINDPNT